MMQHAPKSAQSHTLSPLGFCVLRIVLLMLTRVCALPPFRFVCFACFFVNACVNLFFLFLPF
jgi:hypothetical protein